MDRGGLIYRLDNDLPSLSTPPGPWDAVPGAQVIPPETKTASLARRRVTRWICDVERWKTYFLKTCVKA